jgi:hypothetical protein
LQRILSGDLGAADGDERQTLIKRYLAAQDGPLACERIVEALEQISDVGKADAEPGSGTRLEQWLVKKGLQLARRVKSKLPGSHNHPEFQRHRYPGISLNELRQRLSRFQQLLGYDQALTTEQITDVLFGIRV